MLWLTTWACEGWSANIARRAWILEQISTPITQSFIPSEKGFFRSGMSVGNYSDSLSAQLGLIGDFGPLEMGAYASQRVYGKWNEDGKDFEKYSQHEAGTFAVELARLYTSRDGHSGRLGVQFIRFPQITTTYIRLGVNMGVFEKKDSTWILRLNTHLFLSRETSKVISTSVEVGQRFKELGDGRMRIGGLFGWTYRTEPEQDPTSLSEFSPLRHEHMLFSVGPWVEYLTTQYSLKLSAPWRIWMDKETYWKSSPTTSTHKLTVVHYPVDTRIPDFTLNFCLFL